MNDCRASILLALPHEAERVVPWSPSTLLCYTAGPVRETLQALHARAPSLQLGSADLCFLVALQLRAKATESATFAEDVLFDVHAETMKAITDTEPSGDEPGEANDGGGSTLRVRATAALRRLRAQRLLIRVDGAGVRRAGEFSLSRLSLGIIEFFLEEDVLTRQNLALLLGALAERLRSIRDAAAAQRGDDWFERVTLPLKVTASDLVAGIERRQRGFDLQQEEFQRRVTELLRADWFGAVAECEALLNETSAMLRELYALLLRDGQSLADLLVEIQELAGTAPSESAAAAEREARRLGAEVDRMNAWGSERQRAWAEYHEQVHRYLRDVVRLDPSRAVIDRIRAALVEGTRSFSLVVAQASSITLLRPAVTEVPKPPVRRPKKEVVEGALSDEATVDPVAELEAKVRASLANGPRQLSSVTQELAAEVEAEGERFALAGRVAQVVGRIAQRLDAPRERTWNGAGGDLVVEEWSAHGG